MNNNRIVIKKETLNIKGKALGYYKFPKYLKHKLNLIIFMKCCLRSLLKPLKYVINK